MAAAYKLQSVEWSELVGTNYWSRWIWMTTQNFVLFMSFFMWIHVSSGAIVIDMLPVNSPLYLIDSIHYPCESSGFLLLEDDGDNVKLRKDAILVNHDNEGPTV